MIGELAAKVARGASRMAAGALAGAARALVEAPAEDAPEGRPGAPLTGEVDVPPGALAMLAGSSSSDETSAERPALRGSLEARARAQDRRRSW